MIQLKKTFEKAMDSGALQELAGRIQAGIRSPRLSGAAGGARALGISGAVLAENRSVAVLTPSGAEAQHLARELGFYLDLLSSSPVDIVHMADLEVDPYRGLSPHHEISANRAHALWRILQDGPKVLVASIKAAAVRLRTPEQFFSYCLMLKKDEDISPDRIREYLFESGYIEDDPVTDPGEFSLRGGILDIFPPHLDKPVRLEFFGDCIESLRIFDVDSQRSVESIPYVELIPMREYCFRRDTLQQWAEKVPSLWSEPFLPHLVEEIGLARQGEMFPAFEFLLPAVDPLEGTLFDYLKGYRIIAVEREASEDSLNRYHAELYQRYLDRIEAHKPVLSPDQIYVTAEDFSASLDRFPNLEVEELAIADKENPPVYLSAQTTRKYHGNIRALIGDIEKSRDAGEHLAFVLSNLGRAERIRDILKEYEIPARLCRDQGGELDGDLPPGGDILIAIGNLHAGYYLPAANLRVLTSSDLFDESDVGSGPRKTKAAHRQLFLSDFRDLKPGDYVVHVDHGIGLFNGLKSIGLHGSSKEFVLLSYQNDAKLYVPVERLDLIQKYSSMGGTRPTLDRLGGMSWSRTKSRIKKSMRDMAEELLKLYARRKTIPGYAFSSDTAWQQEFEDAFEFELTRDQVDAL
ncbi:MAG: hypothetical protein JXR49_20025, partial [Acidobacteria bacterium]|nr:hypothetical protein [Acidobacteriota bacterium]